MTGIRFGGGMRRLFSLLITPTRIAVFALWLFLTWVFIQSVGSLVADFVSGKLHSLTGYAESDVTKIMSDYLFSLVAAAIIVIGVFLLGRHERPQGRAKLVAAPWARAGGSPAIGVAVPTVAASATATDTTRSTPSVSEQLGNAILAHVESSPSSGRIDFHLSLNPPDLGPVRVQLTLTNQTLSARLVANDPATQQLIQNQMDALRQRLQETGLSLGQFDVSGGSSGSAGQQQQSLLPFADLNDDRSVPVSTVSTSAVPRSVGTIDLVA